LGGGQALEGGSPNHPRTPDLSTDQLLSGAYATDELVAAAAVLRAAGWSEDRIRREVYAPFIVVGPASWTDSWHAPRYGPGSIVRRHEGQDVLCRYGTEVLAPEDGTIAFETGLLGGRSAHLFLPDGGYYYFAHFSEWNDRQFSDGDEVHRGDVIGYCGDTGNATVPHVHFGWYGPDGVAIDPMGRLIAWLHEAESGLGAVLARAVGDAVDTSTTAIPTSLLPAVELLREGLLDRPGVADPSLLAVRSTSTGGGQPLDLTSILLVLLIFGMGGRVPRGSRRLLRLTGEGAALLGPHWRERRGPLLS
jgi:murein DD-endopeptidase MepM/ murein hydrolase activator NlpD